MGLDADSTAFCAGDKFQAVANAYEAHDKMVEAGYMRLGLPCPVFLSFQEGVCLCFRQLSYTFFFFFSLSATSVFASSFFERCIGISRVLTTHSPSVPKNIAFTQRNSNISSNAGS